VGGWEELEEHEHDRWQKHRCGPDCVSPCFVARCRESDGFWTWCVQGGSRSGATNLMRKVCSWRNLNREPS
jgi:hypothetical protein